MRELMSGGERGFGGCESAVRRGIVDMGVRADMLFHFISWLAEHRLSVSMSRW